VTVVESLALAIPLALPGVGFLLGMTVGRGSLVAGIVGSSLAGAATGAYLGAAATPLAPDLEPSVIAIRGGLVGLGIGVAVGVVLAAALFAWRSSRPVPAAAGMTRTRSSTVPLLIAAVLLASCAKPAPDNVAPRETLIYGLATVQFVELEGGCWTLDLAGERLLPLALPEEFRVDGLRVRVSLQLVEAATICMMGRAVEIKSIERVE